LVRSEYQIEFKRVIFAFSFHFELKPRRVCCYIDHHHLMDGHDPQDPKQSPADMTAFVQNLLQQMQNRFQTMSDSIVTKNILLFCRINELEQSINDLRAEMGVESSPSPAAPAKLTEEITKEEGSA
ncbi:Heat shock factor-binding protein 1, partial [Glycine soja]